MGNPFQYRTPLENPAFHILRLRLGIGQDFNQLSIIQQVPFGAGQPFKELLPERLQALGVVGGVFLELHQHLFQGALPWICFLKKHTKLERDGSHLPPKEI